MSKLSKRLSLKQLECRLQDIDEFEKPRIELEQYATPPHIAATILTTIDSTYDHLRGRFVADLGCGTGRLTIGSVLCGASQVVGYDVDRTALQCAISNVNQLFGDNEDSSEDGDLDCTEGPSELALGAYKGCRSINFVLTDVASMNDCDGKKFDTVIMNPPFGTKQNQGLDMVFLKQAIRMSAGFVYSLHKTSTRDVS